MVSAWTVENALVLGPYKTEEIISKEADYILSLKENQPMLYHKMGEFDKL